VVQVARCDVCGNDYDKSFVIQTAGGGGGTFDSFECAIHAVSPACEHCGCKVLGHGVESDGRFFCCAHCARESGVGGLADRAEG
jgi:Rieske Fe-S protein